MKNFSVRSFVLIGMLSSLSFILMMIKFPIPIFPSFLKVDFSDIPALIAAFTLGPVAAILVELFKNVLDYIASSSETGIPIGHLSNFASGILFVLPTYWIFNRFKAKWGLVVSLISATLFMSIIMSLLNYFAILPAYIKLLNWPAMSTSELRVMVVGGILPFNIVKGLIVTVVFVLLYSRLQHWLNKQITYKNS
ncbi:ECF transporter S component [Bacillus niameyensis]|uniref:ECF transporter S component n=1 Tax=Bacillus niameyensis TaxID=1522308 RepID=UPI000785B0FC|nr:ECF transporter S component [Bacillus niameyensis]